MIRIEVQDQFGQWHRYKKVANAPPGSDGECRNLWIHLKEKFKNNGSGAC